jgi:xylose isomerase
LKEKARQWNENEEIQALAAEVNADPDDAGRYLGDYSSQRAAALQEADFDREALGERGLAYERLDQLTADLLLGV